MGNVLWHQMRAEELPGDLPAVRVVSFAKSFHWIDRRRVAAAVRRMLATDGALVHVSATTLQGVETEAELRYPQPPRKEITRLVRRYLGPRQRAGQGVLSAGTHEGEDPIYRAAGFSGPQRLEVPRWVVERSVEEIAASVYSLSGSAPHLFATRLGDFEAELQRFLAAASPDGRFSGQIGSIGLNVWRCILSQWRIPCGHARSRLRRHDAERAPAGAVTGTGTGEAAGAMSQMCDRLDLIARRWVSAGSLRN